jgi:hypothetical protein
VKNIVNSVRALDMNLSRLKINTVGTLAYSFEIAWLLSTPAFTYCSATEMGSKLIPRLAQVLDIIAPSESNSIILLGTIL